MEKGLIHIYHGDGKGKTTCAIGLAIRALGAGYKVLFVQFLKGNHTSELNVLHTLEGFEIVRCEKDYKFTWLLNEDELQSLKHDHTQMMHGVIKKCFDKSKVEGERVLLVLDELCATYKKDLVEKELVLNFLTNKPDNIEVVITGREPEPELIQLADYISEIKKIRHPMDNNIYARKGIES